MPLLNLHSPIPAQFLPFHSVHRVRTYFTFLKAVKLLYTDADRHMPCPYSDKEDQTMIGTHDFPVQDNACSYSTQLVKTCRHIQLHAIGYPLIRRYHCLNNPKRLGKIIFTLQIISIIVIKNTQCIIQSYPIVRNSCSLGAALPVKANRQQSQNCSVIISRTRENLHSEFIFRLGGIFQCQQISAVASGDNLYITSYKMPSLNAERHRRLSAAVEGGNWRKAEPRH